MDGEGDGVGEGDGDGVGEGDEVTEADSDGTTCSTDWSPPPPHPVRTTSIPTHAAKVLVMSLRRAP